MMIGIDEAGRGAWAGPIVAAAVYFKVQPRRLHPWLRDSKLLSSRQREVVYDWLQEYCQIGFGLATNHYIDRHGLQRANVIVVEKAYKKLVTGYKLRVTGGIVIDYIGGFQKLTALPSIYSLHKNGEAKFPVIAAASICAKVYRDALMTKLARRWPLYLFDEHKGYGTRQHRQRLKEYGPSRHHRRSFRPIQSLFS